MNVSGTILETTKGLICPNPSHSPNLIHVPRPEVGRRKSLVSTLFCVLLVVVEFHQLCGPLIYVCTLVMLHGSTLHMCLSSEYSVYYNRSSLECPPVARHS